MDQRIGIQLDGPLYQLMIVCEQLLCITAQTNDGQLSARRRHAQENLTLHQAFGMLQFFDGLGTQACREFRIAPKSREHALCEVLLDRAHLVVERACQPPQRSRIDSLGRKRPVDQLRVEVISASRPPPLTSGSVGRMPSTSLCTRAMMCAAHRTTTPRTRAS